MMRFSPLEGMFLWAWKAPATLKAAASPFAHCKQGTVRPAIPAGCGAGLASGSSCANVWQASNATTKKVGHFILIKLVVAPLELIVPPIALVRHPQSESAIGKKKGRDCSLPRLTTS